MTHVLQASLQVIPEKEAQLWWAAKELNRDKKLQDYIGKNEKTKIVVKIQKVIIVTSFSLSQITVHVTFLFWLLMLLHAVILYGIA